MTKTLEYNDLCEFTRACVEAIFFGAHTRRGKLSEL